MKNIFLSQISNHPEAWFLKIFLSNLGMQYTFAIWIRKAKIWNELVSENKFTYEEPVEENGGRTKQWQIICKFLGF